MLRSHFDRTFGTAQRFDFGEITFLSQGSCVIYITEYYDIVVVPQKELYCFIVNHDFIFVLWTALLNSSYFTCQLQYLIKHYHCLLLPYLEPRVCKGIYAIVDCVKCVPRICSAELLWTSGQVNLLLAMTEAKTLEADPAMERRPVVALALGFWLDKWDTYSGWPYATHRYLRTCESDSYLYILPDRKNIITLIKRFLL